MLDAKANPLLEDSEGKTPRAMVCDIKSKEIHAKIKRK